jgi:hypothetical protein
MPRADSSGNLTRSQHYGYPASELHDGFAMHLCHLPVLGFGFGLLGHHQHSMV